MDLHTVDDVVDARTRADLAAWQPGDAFLAGGSWLFSEPQPGTRRLVDLTSFGWPDLTVTDAGLEIAATCTLAALARFTAPLRWPAAGLFPSACHALLGSFKVWKVATVGGNICLALPAGPMTSLAAGLDGIATLWAADGGVRDLPVAELVTGNRSTALRPGEVLRSVLLPDAALRSRAVFRQESLSAMGRSGVVVLGRIDPSGQAVFTITAATPRPVQLCFAALPSAAELSTAAASADIEWFGDSHGLPEWRADVTMRLLDEARAELATG